MTTNGDRFSEGDLVRLVAPVEGERFAFPRGSEARVMLAFGLQRATWAYDLAVLTSYGDVAGALFDVPHGALTVVARRARG